MTEKPKKEDKKPKVTVQVFENTYEALARIQKTLKAPKNQFNKFGYFSYRSCEDILEAVKPLLGKFVVLLSDEVVPVGDRYYIKSTATFTKGEESEDHLKIKAILVSAFARESLTKKGMDDSQITGSTSSYARK
jgi:hypothetical protein